jgi:hypothetical protein
MTIAYSNFFAPTVLGTAAATLFTTPVTPTTTLLRGGRMRFTNTTSSAVTVTAYAVPPAGTASAGNSFVSSKVVAANDYIDSDMPILPAGAFVQAFAGTATAITAHMISGAYFQ